ncbi:MAG: hypothetical protein LC772_02225 [Chloroflexi bacterium]|nr:hypothetical protein [Chloroflexota bacterium]
MWIRAACGAIGAVAFTGISIIWLPFASSVYPYTISQPSSFQHLIIRDTSNQQQVDYFFGGQGTAFTNVNIAAVKGSRVEKPVQYLQSKDATHIRRGGVITILGKRRRWTLAKFHGLVARWSVETTTFVAGGWTWRMTVSHDAPNKRLIPLMEKMVRTFKLKHN